MMGKPSRFKMEPTARVAWWQKSSAVKSMLGWTVPRRWCGTPRHSSSVTLLVVMSRPSYTCILSELTISAGGKWVARSMPSFDFPVPVAPIMTTTFSLLRCLNSDSGDIVSPGLILATALHTAETDTMFMFCLSFSKPAKLTKHFLFTLVILCTTTTSS
ncbi:hypothetical protein V8G54_013910 [Vigna mungo]|uniref:Uncharacterized protein n=1 Tax=Vigna mungo TaxID=3915 RepID=A0AAQ3NGP5_VIGMU